MASPPRIVTTGSYSTHQEYFIDFFGNDLLVTVTPTPSVIRRWICAVVYYHRRFRFHKPLVVGVCVNWTPRFRRSDPPADTLHLCVGRRCIIIQLTHCYRLPLILRRFLSDPTTTFVGVWNGQDAGKLERSEHALEIGKLLDIRKFVDDSEGRSLRRCSFGEIVEVCMGYEGVELDHEISVSDWSVHNLSLDQIRQASIKALVCCKLGVSEKLWEVC